MTNCPYCIRAAADKIQFEELRQFSASLEIDWSISGPISLIDGTSSTTPTSAASSASAPSAPRTDFKPFLVPKSADETAATGNPARDQQRRKSLFNFGGLLEISAGGNTFSSESSASAAALTSIAAYGGVSGAANAPAHAHAHSGSDAGDGARSRSSTQFSHDSSVRGIASVSMPAAASLNASAEYPVIKSNRFGMNQDRILMLGKYPQPIMRVLDSSRRCHKEIPLSEIIQVESQSAGGADKNNEAARTLLIVFSGDQRPFTVIFGTGTCA